MVDAIIEHYRDAHLLVVEKPYGLATQPTRDGAMNLYELLCGKEDYVGLHHRLDTPASGLMLLALDRRVNADLARAFRERRVKRNYQMVVIGHPAGEEGSWTKSVDGKKAHTNWKLLQKTDGMAHLEAELETGRTHQIRRHAVQAGHPIVGDKRYGGGAARLWDRLALHATKLVFEHPVSREVLSLSCPMPPNLQGLMARFEGTS